MRNFAMRSTTGVSWGGRLAWPVLIGLTLSLLSASSPAAADQVEVTTLDGAKTKGQITAWTDEAIALKTDAGERRFAVKQLATIRPVAIFENAAAVPKVWVQMVDGSTLEAVDFTAAAGEAKLTTSFLAAVKFPTRAVAAVRFKQQETAELKTQWAQIREAKPTGDVIVVRKKQALDFLEGVIEEVTPEQVKFKVGDDSIPVKRDKVEGLIYFAATPPTLASLVCMVTTHAGATINAQRVRYADKEWTLVSQAGAEIILPFPLVDKLDYSAASVQYLSDLTPEAVAYAPYLGLPLPKDVLARFGAPALDRALEGGPLRFTGANAALGKQRAAEDSAEDEPAKTRGLALRSRTELTYRLPGKFRRFQATAFIDPAVRAAGNVRLVIRADDKELYAATIIGQDQPQAIDLDIAGRKRLTILVDYGEDLDIADHLDLAEARITQ